MDPIQKSEALFEAFAVEAYEEEAWKRRTYTRFCCNVYGGYTALILWLEQRDWAEHWLWAGAIVTFCLILSWSLYLRTLVHVVRGTYGIAKDETDVLLRLIRRWQEEQGIVPPLEVERTHRLEWLKASLVHAKYNAPDSRGVRPFALKTRIHNKGPTGPLLCMAQTDGKRSSLPVCFMRAKE